MKETYLAMRPSDTERDMCFRVGDGTLRSGAESLAFTHIKQGPTPASHIRTHQIIKRNPVTVLKADAGGRYRR
ncbi:MAG: hypothetical protein AAF493_20040 [Pseudomonadota bacterium]